MLVAVESLKGRMVFKVGNSNYSGLGLGLGLAAVPFTLVDGAAV